ncbi:MAG: heme exporter protein CcmB [Chloroflexi bacterium]|nr:heme exporter protein CcmB [Chloroflexota bacterium]
MKLSLGPVWAVAKKDLLLEVRNREIVISILVFSGLVFIIFNFAIELTRVNRDTVGPGVLWVAFIFAAILGLNRSFIIEKDGNALEGMMLSPVSRDTILVGKTLGNLLFMITALVVLFPVFTALFNVNVLKVEIIVIAVLATIGLSTIGTMFAALSVNTRAREIMLPVLFLPIAVPILIAAVEGTAQVTQGGSWSEAAEWFQVLAAFDIVFVIAALLTFQFLLED